MTLTLHSGAHPVTFEQLRDLQTPQATETHVPIPHSSVVEMVRYSLGFFGHEIVDEHYGVTPDGARFFGVLNLRSEYGDYSDTVGLRNSHDKRFPIGVSFGSRVFVCDNLAFIGDHVIRRKHTKSAKRDLPGLVAELIEPLRDVRLKQAATISGYQRTGLTDSQVNDIIMQLYRRGVINVTRIADVLDAYLNPPHDWGDETGWRLFNATTFSLRNVTEDPSITARLHNVIDAYCEPVDTNQLLLPHLAAAE